MTSLESAATAAPAVRGEVVRPGDAGYDELRTVHNAMIDRRPAAIVRVADAADVAVAIAYAREHGRRLAIRGGGHSTAGHGSVDGGVVLDLRGLDRVTVDPAAMTVSVAGGASMGQVDAVAQAHGLAVTGARMSDVGFAGFTTGSGSGWLERAAGLAADSLVAARVVTADGREVVASAAEHPDLFWGIRGGGGNFGVVTELTLRAMPLGPQVVGGLRVYPFERAEELVTTYAQLMVGARDELCGGLVLMSAPPLPFLPPELHGRPVVATVALWAGAEEDAAAGLAPLAALGEPIADLVAPMPYVQLQRFFEQRPKLRMRSYQKFGVARQLTAPAIAAFCDLAAELTPGASILLQPLGGAFGRVAERETALGDRDAGWAYQLVSTWPDAAEDAPSIAWTRAAAAELSDHARPSAWPNFTADAGRRGLAVPYAPATLARLREVKRAWDPDNTFRQNHNIGPD